MLLLLNHSNLFIVMHLSVIGGSQIACCFISQHVTTVVSDAGRQEEGGLAGARSSEQTFCLLFCSAMVNHSINHQPTTMLLEAELRNHSTGRTDNEMPPTTNRPNQSGI